MTTTTRPLRTPGSPLGVGFLGAGPVTQAIHLPTLARMPELFRVIRVMDVDAGVAASVAARVGADSSTDTTALLADPRVDVVAICSPHAFHAEHVIAACRAGVAAVLCEKPFAMTGEEAAGIAAVSAETGVPILVGAMHAYDAGWLAAAAAGVVPHTIRSSIVLPLNARFEDAATEILSRPDPAPFDAGDSEQTAAAVAGGVMGLAVHDLPLVRELLGRVSPSAWSTAQVVSAEFLAPFGYLVVLTAGDVLVELHAVMGTASEPDWRLTAIGTDDAGDDLIAEVRFTPSYVQAGSATAEIIRASGSLRVPPTDRNGYEDEWRHLAELARGAAPLRSASSLIDDLVFALSIAEAAADPARSGALAEAAR
ncbi:Gfo/Idh/MocA family oxidoreductase [Rathayibacter caricis]|uniref:Gfo/Idh/MocA family protein n=1 Tax=Rathayibacter caricis TaxID=110936 RepID=UPI001FB48224|nr:Gfo/Idh/MocA family oxidoreductase [Rathayibacter caricis]MCJ1698063.1 Gfo/Idh/MocA family oxidoreductase [Rathayibacter caricis]